MHVITLALFATQNANDEAVRKAYLAKAREFLAPHKMSIEIYVSPGGDEKPRTLPYNKSINDEKDGGTLRAMCHTVLSAGRGIPVIFGMFFQASDYGAMVYPSHPQNGGIKWLPYIMINTRLHSKNEAVLLHELIHAAYGEFPPAPPGGVHDTDVNSVFYDYDADSTQSGPALRLPLQHLDPLRRAYFTTYVAQ